MIEQGAELSVTRQCELLDLNRSGVYYTPRPISDQDLRLMRRIDEPHLEHPFYGARRLAKQLEREGYEVGRLYNRRRIHQSHDYQTPDEIYYTTDASKPMTIAA
jgi:putative transposase